MGAATPGFIGETLVPSLLGFAPPEHAALTGAPPQLGARQESLVTQAMSHGASQVAPCLSLRADSSVSFLKPHLR